MKKFIEKKESLLIIVVIILFVFTSYFSITSITQLRGNARVVNYAGIVRGATQRLVKKELQGYPDDSLIQRLDSIVSELVTGEGPNNLVVLRDSQYLKYMDEVQKSWRTLKTEIGAVREGRDKTPLFELSEEYFNLVDQTVSAAELYSEKQVKHSLDMLVAVNAVFVMLILGGIFTFARSVALRKKAEALGKIAYIDPLTQMPNRARCEQEMNRCVKDRQEVTLAVFMFDMNNLKRANDLLGHQGGDRIIAEFARVIRTEGEPFGFVGRYGGDEFIAIFPSADEHIVEKYLARVNEKLIAYNLLHVNEVEKISYAAGYVISTLEEMSIEEMIHEADRRMYVRKRQMKENREV